MKERATEERAHVPLTTEMRQILTAIKAGSVTCQKPYCRKRAARLVRTGKNAPRALCQSCADDAAVDQRMTRMRAERERRVQ